MQKEVLAKRALMVFNILSKEYKDAKTALNYSSPLELLVATILSAQCTDTRVNDVTKTLFQHFQSAQAFAQVDLKELEEAIRPTGFFHNKAKAIKGCCQEIIEKFNGEVPDNLEDLTTLPGVGRKTANVVLGNAFGIPGIVVDTHVKRLSNRLGLSTNGDPVKIELDLMELLPKETWTIFSHLLIYHGRKICVARKPRCKQCSLKGICPSVSI